MEKTEELFDKLHREKNSVDDDDDFKPVAKKRNCEKKTRSTSEIINSEGASVSYDTFAETGESKSNRKNHTVGESKSEDSKVEESNCHNSKIGHMNKLNDLNNSDHEKDVEKPSNSSDEYDDNKVNSGNRKETVIRSQKKEMMENNILDDNMSEDPSEEEDEEEKVANESDESDIVEQDVKVCDICGDAGREDLLAICCRCIDGAEHTYCMKEMIDEVPEGDWLCEECKTEEENKNKNRQKDGSEVASEKDHHQSSGSAAEESRVFMKTSGKRRLEESESSSVVKKQALEMISGSPRTSSSPTKDVDRGKVKSNDQSSSDSVFGNESPARRPRLQSLKGSFIKSKSFNIPSARSKTKLVDEVVLQRQKSTKERVISHDSVREIGKSMSFRSANLGRLGMSGSSKVKMLSPNSSHVQDLKSLKNKKERSFERANSIKLPSGVNLGNLNTSSSTALTPKGENLKGENNKMISGTKSTNRLSTGAEVPVSLGQVNKQLPSPSGVGPTSSSGNISSSEQKAGPVKDDTSPKVAISRDSTNLVDGIKETTTTGLISVSGQNYNKQSHSAQNLHTAERPSGSVGLNASAVRGSKEAKNKDNKLKAAIEAALLKKPGIYRKKDKVSDQSDESSAVVSNMNNEPVFVDRRNSVSLTSAEVSTDRQGQVSRSCNLDYSKQSNGKHFASEVSSYDAVALSSLSKIPAIPDHEYIWQGSFEISRSGKTAEFWDGLQAHLSTCASPRVFETLNNLPHKILLNGVSRISAWPTQFENNGVKEDNIALYFFAKDLESYEKSYQVLLDDMIRGDLALIGSVNGVELLIFPSNQLPEKSHRWNMLFFLWGVLRAKKKNSLHEKVADEPEKSCIPQVVSSISTDKVSSVEDVCSLGSIDKEHVDSESMGDLKLQTCSPERVKTETIISPLDTVVNNNVTPASTSEIASFTPTVKDETPSSGTKNEIQEEVKCNSKLPEIVQGPFVTKPPKEEINLIQIEPRKRAFVDLTEEDDDDDTWHGAEISKKQKSGDDDFNNNINNIIINNNNRKSIFDRDSGPKENNAINGERYFFPVDPPSEVKDLGFIPFIGPSYSERQKTPNLNLALGAESESEEDEISLIGERKNGKMEKKEEEEEDVLASLSLSLSFGRGKKEEDDKRHNNNSNSTPSMLLFRDIIDK